MLMLNDDGTPQDYDEEGELIMEAEQDTFTDEECYVGNDISWLF